MRFLRNLMKKQEIADKKLAKLGFKKVKETKFYVVYERDEDHPHTGSYTHIIDISYRPNGKHWIQTYEKKINSDMFNNTVALTVYEMELILRKIKEKRWPVRR